SRLKPYSEGNHLSISNDIKKLLDIQDPNIIFEKNFIEEGIHKGKPCKYVTGKLTYDPMACKKCGIKNEDNIVIKNGTQTSRITLPISGVQPTYLRLKKQRVVCKACEKALWQRHQLSRGSVIFPKTRRHKSLSGLLKRNL